MSTSVQGAQSFARSIGVLQTIADAAEAVSRATLVKQCGLTRPTLYRIIASLEAEGLIEATAENRYRIGGRVISLARTALAQNDVRREAEPYLTRLRNETGETVHLAIRSGDELVYIDKMESREAVRMTSTIGTRINFHSTSVGKAFLSAMPAQQADALIDRIEMPALTEFTTTDREDLRAIVRHAADQGFVRDDQENEIGIVCFGAAICDSTDNPVASVSVSVPLFRLEDARRYTPPLKEAVTGISKRLGYIGRG
ncbi:IclR family transcriptional regulator [Hwanghaeella grinnelliae]|uniref:IclR family transcriptional regulator n=1 Tax=Hwanghaeella grinnelliae TaxID=2500179 RepID=A0A3S2ZA97_9PROT|nr:IclR family transcriptional regulator [Hwanghaeella grinnelliae]RVU39142.1 IclR family transcriptional regulator [Hwanghaeella grinnelliae]